MAAGYTGRIVLGSGTLKARLGAIPSYRRLIDRTKGIRRRCRSDRLAHGSILAGLGCRFYVRRRLCMRRADKSHTDGNDEEFFVHGISCDSYQVLVARMSDFNAVSS